MANVRLEDPLPPDAAPALEVIEKLTARGHRALLAGGCVRDLKIGRTPGDYDVATSALPEQVAALWRRARLVGAQFGVVLAPIAGKWIEVATFRADGPYLDGRHPTHVRFSTEEEDARRRDFTVNGLFLDPQRSEILDYVGGLPDLDARVIRAIGVAAERFAEDHLRLIRAVRFAARLGFSIEPQTMAAIRTDAEKLQTVAAERIHDELRKILSHDSRATAFSLLCEALLLEHLGGGREWNASRSDAARSLLTALPPAAAFEAAFAVLVLDKKPVEIERICRGLAFSNEEREAVLWLVEHAADLDDPARPSSADLKRLMVRPAFAALRDLADARYAALPNGPERAQTLDQRLRAIPLQEVAPPPLVTGDDLLQRSVPAGPLFKRILNELYTRQLNGQLQARDAALRELDELLRRESAQ